MKKVKTPFLVDITVEYHKTVVIFAEGDEVNAESIAEALHNDDVIDMTPNSGNAYALSCRCEATGIAGSNALDCYEKYSENGKVTSDLETQEYEQFAKAKQYITDFLESENGEADDDTFDDLTNVSLAYTSYEEGSEECNHPYTVDVKADLIGLKINTFINGILVSATQFECLRDMNDNFLFSMDFDDLIYLLDSEWDEYYYALLEKDNAAEKFPPNQKGVQVAKRKYPASTRIQLDEMVKDPQRVPDGTLGTVRYVVGPAGSMRTPALPPLSLWGIMSAS